MRRKQIAAIGMLSVLLGAGSLLASTGAATAGDGGDTAARHCVWHDRAGWHIRVTHRETGRRTFSGRLETSGKFVAVRSVRLEGHDVVRVSPDRHTLTFRFGNYGAIDGLGFRVVCAPSIAFQFGSDGAPASPSDVKIGHDATNPTTVPFAISRSE